MNKIKTGIYIYNERELLRLFKKLDTSDPKASAGIKRVIKAPFTKMRKEARNNLRAQNSIDSGSLYRGLSIGSSNNKRRKKFFAFFGGKYVAPKAKIKVKTFARARSKKQYTKLYSTNHFHLVNSGTIIRKTKKGHNRGASPNTGFADKAIKHIIPTIENSYLKGFSRIYGDITTKNKT